LVDEEDDDVGDRGTEKFNKGTVVAPADDGKAATKLREVDLLAEFVAVADLATPRGGREAWGTEVGGGGGDLGDMVYVRAFREGIFETCTSKGKFVGVANVRRGTPSHGLALLAA